MFDHTKLKLTEVKRSGIFLSLAHVPGTSQVFTGCSDAKVYCVDVAGEKPEFLEMAGHESYVTGLALAGGQLISGSYDGRLIWWDVETRSLVRKVEAHASTIRSVIATPDGKHVISVADDMLTKIWNAESGEAVLTLSNHAAITPHHYPSMLYAVAVSPCGKFVATGDKVGHIAISEIAGGARVAELESPGMYTWDPTQRRHSIGGIRSLAFSPDSKWLAVGGIGKIGNIDHLDGPNRIEVFDVDSRKPAYETSGSKAKGLVERLWFDPTGQWLVAAGGDHKGFLQFYEAGTGKHAQHYDGSTHIYMAQFDPGPAADKPAADNANSDKPADEQPAEKPASDKKSETDAAAHPFAVVYAAAHEKLLVWRPAS